MRNEVNKSECGFTTELVPYMYGELGSTESGVLESHLIECGDCRDEFAAVSSARYEVYDWKQIEFEPLTTPVFEIPYAGVPEPAGAYSWVNKVRAAFSNSWAVPSVAFASVALLSIFAASFYFSGESETVPYLSSNVAVPGPSISPIDLKREVTVKNEDKALSALVPQSVAAPSSTRSTPKPRARDAAAVKRQDNIRTTAVTGRPVPSTSRRAPTLNEFTEEEDTSLRLAQLFDDIDTKD